MTAFLSQTFLPALFNMSLTAGIVILCVIVARLFLKRAPKIFSYALWAVVLFRLLCPSPYSSAVLNFPVYCNTYCSCWGNLSELIPVLPGAASMF